MDVKAKMPRCLLAAGMTSCFCLSSAWAGGDLDMSILDQPDMQSGGAGVGQVPAAGASAPQSQDLPFQLALFINGEDQHLIVTVLRSPNGLLAMNEADLRAAGLKPVASARRADGNYDLSQLPNVSVAYRQEQQELDVTAPISARLPRQLYARERDKPSAESKGSKAQSATGALFNYRVQGSGSYGLKDKEFDYNGVSGTFEGRLFSPIGVAVNSFSLSGGDVRRLSTSYNYSSEDLMTSFTAGDVITGAQTWSRSARLGGFQIDRNFGLRPDLVTMSVPNFTSSAAVPSSVEIYLNDMKRFSQSVGSGPFEVQDMPVVTGSGEARVVVTDENGNKTTTTRRYYVSSRLLKPKLLDYSFEMGLPRTGYGTQYDTYDPHLYGSGTIRYGLTPGLTFEGHAEGGTDLALGGAGVVAGLGPWGIFSLAGAGSASSEGAGALVNASAEFEFHKIRLHGRLERTFNDFNDIASITSRSTSEESDTLFSGSMTRALDQVSLSIPVFNDGSYLGLSYTNLRTTDDTHSQVLSSSWGRSFGKVYAMVTAYGDLQDHDYGGFLNVSFPLGRTGIRASASAQTSGSSSYVKQRLSRSADNRVGRLGWSVSAQEGESDQFDGRADIKTPYAKFEGSYQQANDAALATATVSGSIVAMDGSVLLGNRINDAFAVVDAGAPGVEVQRENNPVTETGWNGKALVAGLNSYEQNIIGIDPSNLPLNAAIDKTKLKVDPMAGSGVIVQFTKHDGGTALVSFVQADGTTALPVGSTGTLAGAPRDADPIFVGYDGQAYISGLQSKNQVTLHLPTGASCTASFSYKADGSNQVYISKVPCT